MEKYSQKEPMNVDERLNNGISYKDEVEVAAMILCIFKSKNEPWWKNIESGFPNNISHPPTPGPPPFIPLQEEQKVEIFGNDILDSDLMEQEINKIAQPYSIVWTTKKLYMSDVTDSQGRLSLHRRFVTKEILPSLLKEGEIFENGIKVKVFDNRLRTFDMVFKDWGSLMVLTSGWNQLVHANKDLEEGVTIKIWVFRDVEEDKLCFAICGR